MTNNKMSEITADEELLQVPLVDEDTSESIDSFVTTVSLSPPPTSWFTCMINAAILANLVVSFCTLVIVTDKAFD